MYAACRSNSDLTQHPAPVAMRALHTSKVSLFESDGR